MYEMGKISTSPLPVVLSSASVVLPLIDACFNCKDVIPPYSEIYSLGGLTKCFKTASSKEANIGSEKTGEDRRDFFNTLYII